MPPKAYQLKGKARIVDTTYQKTGSTGRIRRKKKVVQLQSLPATAGPSNPSLPHHTPSSTSDPFSEQQPGQQEENDGVNIGNDHEYRDTAWRKAKMVINVFKPYLQHQINTSHSIVEPERLFATMDT